jgi:hypothetical protein
LKVTNYEEGKVKKGGENKWKTQKNLEESHWARKKPVDGNFSSEIGKKRFPGFSICY